MTANGTYDITARTWTHIKVLYILIILLSAVALALFIVCFMMVLEVQRGLNSEMKLRQVSIACIHFLPLCVQKGVAKLLNSVLSKMLDLKLNHSFVTR